jgi:hypothetical protein
MLLEKVRTSYYIVQMKPLYRIVVFFKLSPNTHLGFDLTTTMLSSGDDPLDHAAMIFDAFASFTDLAVRCKVILSIVELPIGKMSKSKLCIDMKWNEEIIYWLTLTMYVCKTTWQSSYTCGGNLTPTGGCQFGPDEFDSLAFGNFSSGIRAVHPLCIFFFFSFPFFLSPKSRNDACARRVPLTLTSVNIVGLRHTRPGYAKIAYRSLLIFSVSLTAER